MEELLIAIYESEANGEITESTRDELLFIVQEGANLDLLEVYTRDVKQAKSDLKEAKKLLKAKEYDEAYEKFMSTKKYSDKIKKYVEKADDTALEKIIGGFAVGWKDYVFTLFQLGTLAFTGGISMAVVNKAKKSGIKAPSLPKKPNTIYNQKFDWAEGEWVLNSKGLEKQRKYAEAMKNYEKEMVEYTDKIAEVTGMNSKVTKIFGGLLCGLNIALAIIKVVDNFITVVKTSEGAKKLLEKDMDKEHWDRMVTKTYNPLRAYIYQICDEISSVSERCAGRAKALKSMTSLIEESVDTKLAIHEKYCEGLITESERDALLDMVEEKTFENFNKHVSDYTIEEENGHYVAIDKETNEKVVRGDSKKEVEEDLREWIKDHQNK